MAANSIMLYFRILTIYTLGSSLKYIFCPLYFSVAQRNYLFKLHIEPNSTILEIKNSTELDPAVTELRIESNSTILEIKTRTELDQ